MGHACDDISATPPRELTAEQFVDMSAAIGCGSGRVTAGPRTEHHGVIPLTAKKDWATTRPAASMYGADYALAARARDLPEYPHQ